MKTIKVKIGTYPSVNFLSKLVNLFSSIDSVAYIETENGERRVSAKSLIGLLSFKLRLGQVICISFFGTHEDSDAKYIEKAIMLL